MIAEDDPSIQHIYAIILEREGYDVEISSDGKVIYEESGPLPNLFILDKQLEELNGLDICRYLKSKPVTREIPVIMISATPDLGPLSREAGAEDYLQKPFSVNHLLQKINNVLSRVAY